MDRFTASDASLLHGETPEWHLHVTTLLPLDPCTMPRRYCFDTFRDALAVKLREVPRFRQRVAVVPLGLDRPVWLDGGPFDSQTHIRRARLPAPGGRRELFALAGQIASVKLSHDRPLWECWLVESPGGRLEALLIKNHHVLFDGVGGLESLQAMFDFTAEELAISADTDTSAGPAPDSMPGPVELMARSAARAVLVQPWETAKVARQLIRQGVPFARALLGSNRPLLGLNAPPSPLGGRLSAERSAAGAELPMPLVKAIRHEARVKVNDVLLAVVGGALRSYLHDNDHPVDQAMIANVAVSTRGAEEHDDAGNKFSVMYATLGTHIADPAARLRAIHASTVRAKHLLDDISASRDTTISAIAPPLLVDALGRLYRAAGLENRIQLIGNVGVSNVAGPPLTLYICGAAVNSIFVFGPLMLNSTINFTAVSNADNLDIGITSSPTVVPDLYQFADYLPPALHQLADAFQLRSNQ